MRASDRFRRTLAIAVSAAVVAASLSVSVADAAPAPRRTKASTGRAALQRTTTAKKTPARASASSKTPSKASRRATTAARRRALARARAAARAREARELATPRFKLDGDGREVPAPRAAAAIILDPVTNEVLFEERAAETRSIASITKVMTALVFLESLPDLSQTVEVEREDVRAASTTYLRKGYVVTAGDLLHLLLIGSDNAASRVLARMSSYGAEGFVERMNAKARELGLVQTQYVETSGLFAGNMSTAYEQARLIAYAAADERIGSIMRMSEYSFQVGARTVHVSSTNRFIRTGELEVLGGKTGFINNSGYCLATLVRVPQTGRQLAFVVLGANSNAARFAETKHLFNWLNGHSAFVANEGAAQAQPQQ